MPLTKSEHLINHTKIIDDLLGGLVLSHKEAMEEFLYLRIGKRIEIKRIETQVVGHSFLGHSVRFDVVAYDYYDNIYAVELQRKSEDWPPHRTFSYLLFLQERALPKGARYDQCKNVHLLILLENDNKYNLCKDQFVREVSYPDAEHMRVTYVNVSKADDTPFGELMRDFLEIDCSKIKNQTFKQRVEYYKNTKGGYKIMTSVSEQIFKLGREEGREEAEKAVAKKLIAQNLLSLEQIAEATGISMERLVELQNETK
jgi:hypothetical protein